MVAALALMESPAIIVGIVLLKLFSDKDNKDSVSWSEVMREAFLNGSIFLFVGSVAIGIVTGAKGWEKLHVFTDEVFYGVLAFFLLAMGMIAARTIKHLTKTGSFLIGFSIFMPLAIGVLWIYRNQECYR